ncbi:acetyl-CoA carboxylase carboxyltransferase subunit alpha [Candidatus Ventrimonas sp. KK005]|nr:acetyl-CoA carboxylase carboxyltransferase subunit beta [Lachnospiraceae bacterium]NBH17734.1 acetyl-CoA carboxylase carboxyltransferase subunit beta [Clostridiaceae bacterium]
MLKNMFKKTYTVIDTKYRSQRKEEEPNIPQGLWRKCNKCGQPIYVEDVKNNFYVCPKCGGYFRVHAFRRIEMLIDEGTFEEWNGNMEFTNPLNFPGYERKVQAAKERTNLNEAIVTGKGKIGGQDTAFGVCDARFLMSSMGHIVGEKVTQMVERATSEKLPVILFACSGGARMQEGIVSLMQMAKTSAALKKHHEAGQLFISVLTDPTTGGVTASFAMLGDIILAEPNALIGFAGPRVIEQTIRQKLPEGFQRAEFLLEHGFVDKIVERKDQKEVLSQILRLHGKGEENGYVIPDNVEEAAGIVREPLMSSSLFDFGRNKRNSKKKENSVPEEKTAWDMVQLSRAAGRLTAADYINAVFDEFVEFHGDRYFGDDGAIIGGIASFHGRPVTVIGQQKGKNTKENIKCNFGMPSPEGYRKALRLMKQAETFGRPVICLVDTPGAFCGLEAEERGQGEAIARNLFEMASLKVPVLSIVIGEGGSGGALALAVANEVWMMENAIYSILSPEGFASILWKDSKKAPDAARVMKITAVDLYEQGFIEQIIPEEEPANSDTLPVLSAILKGKMEEFLLKYDVMTEDEIVEQRYKRFRVM